MFFNEKLDFLLRLTNTTNSRLARAAKLDNSFVSRLRSGERNPSRRENYLKSFADYFAKRLTFDYQQAALCEAVEINRTSLPQSFEELSELIKIWLTGEEIHETGSVENFVENWSLFKKKEPTLTSRILKELSKLDVPVNGQAFFGNEGKRQALLSFFTLVNAQKKPTTLLLFSEENITWLTENPEFTATWALLMSQVIAKGNKIKIIHTVNRSLDEMLAAISQWMPLYMSGAIEPYYYPKYREGVFKRTLFLVPDIVAVVANAVGDGAENTSNFIFTNPGVLFSLQSEFNAYLSLCRPLIHIFTKAEGPLFFSSLSEFEDEKADTIIKTASLSDITMPLDLVKTISDRMHHPIIKNSYAFQKNRVQNFEKGLSVNRFAEIISLPKLSNISSGRLPIGFSDLAYENGLYYTPQEFISHLQNVIRLLETYDHYQVCLETKKTSHNILIYAKEQIGVIIARCEFPSVIFAINESNMTSAFWDYMEGRTHSLALQAKSKVIEQLKTFLDELEQEITSKPE